MTGCNGYLDGGSADFCGITDSPLPLLHLHMCYCYDEAHLHPAEKLLRQLLSHLPRNPAAKKWSPYNICSFSADPMPR